MTSGYIDENTRIIFRSSSAKFFLFIQMSREMWEFDEDGELYFEKVVNNFLPELFNKWKEEGTNHVVSIVLFTRVFYDTNDPLDELVNKSEDGRYYKDFYKVIADWETTDDWISVIRPLKDEQLKFQRNVLMREEDGRSLVSGRIACAFDGNVLEAVNLALNPFDNHFVDRDLMRTGLSIILITPGSGKFSVDKKLLRLTNERMTDNGIAMDLVCLSPLPLHVTPLFIFQSSPPPLEIAQEHLLAPPRQIFGKGGSPDTKLGNMTKQKTWDPLYQDDTLPNTYTHYAVPHWVDCSFYHQETGRFFKQDKFRSRCKMYELQMMGIMEHDLTGISIPYLTDASSGAATAGVASAASGGLRTLRTQRSSSSLNETMSAKSLESTHANGEAYLSRSANFTSMRHPTFLSASENNATAPTKAAPIDYERYDSLIFKSSLEPRFSKKLAGPTTPASKPITGAKVSQKNSFESPDRPDGEYWLMRSNAPKPTMTWHHGDQRRVTAILSQSQQAGSKVAFDSTIRKDDQIMRVHDIFKGPSPGRDDNPPLPRIRPSRRGTVNSNDVRMAAVDNGQQSPGIEEDDMVVVTTSTVEPVPINNKNSANRLDSRKSNNQSPRQTHVAGSASSLHKHSGNSDFARTSVGGQNRSSPSHSGLINRNSSLRSGMINPCDPTDHTLLFTSHLRRWLHALPRIDQYDGTRVHWRSLTSPACLPLTTDYFPSNDELKSDYRHYMYTVSASEDANLYQAGDRSISEHKRTANLLMEMLSQRLAQGFQIIVDITGSTYPKAFTKTYDSSNNIGGGGGNGKDSNNAAGPPASVGTATITTAVPGTAAVTKGSGSLRDEDDAAKWKHMVWWLSMGHQVHQLTFDSSCQNVEVRRYVRQITFDIKKITYKCAIWPKHIQNYKQRNISFSYPSLLYAWNYLDHLVAGYQDELTNNLRFWRARFIVIPRKTLPSNTPLGNMASAHNLDEEEKRLELFDIWLQNLRKAKWLAPEEREMMQKRRKKELGYTDFGLKITTMDPSAYLTNEATKTLQPVTSESSTTVSQHTSLLSTIGNLGQPLGLTRDSKSKDIALAMRDPKAGVKMIDRRWHIKVYNNSFIGSEFVDWLISQFDDINTREEAVAFGNVLMQRKPPLFVSSSSRHSLLDGHYFYRLHNEFLPSQQPQKPWFTITKSKSSMSVALSGSNGGASGKGKEREGASSSEASSPLAVPPVGSKKIEFDMTRSMIIDVDPYKKSDRRETAILHYDTLHNASNCYHFQLNWLGCTAQLVQELVQNWSRQAERCGLLVVEGSVDQAYDDTENNNPFQCPVPIDLAVPPPSVADLNAGYDIPENFYVVALVRHMGFVLDVEADAKFERAKAGGIQVRYSYHRESYKYDQYIHRSGVAFVQIRPDNQGFYWVNNRLYTNHTPALVMSRRRENSSLMHPELLRQTFQEFCADPVRLAEFWERTCNNLMADHHTGAEAWVFENVQVMPPSLDTGAIATEDEEQSTTTETMLKSPDIESVVSGSSSHQQQATGANVSTPTSVSTTPVGVPPVIAAAGNGGATNAGNGSNASSFSNNIS
ncbi:hypothetical protein BX666DRAFT_1945315 [Dichotomocladium elegans]|nr:hypothetical protein BX666DRAFT_1945315 [Dichotomocladium elegans]